MRVERLQEAVIFAAKLDQALEAKRPRAWKPADLARVLSDFGSLGLDARAWESRIKNYRTRGHRIPEADVTEAIARALDVDLRWLRDPMPGPIVWEYTPSNADLQPPSILESDSPAFTVPYWGQVPCGDWERPEPGDSATAQLSPRLRKLLIERRIKLTEIVTVRVRGRSMEPRFFQGELVAIRLTKEKVDNVIVLAMNQDNELTLKLLRNIDGRWGLHSIDPAYGVTSADSVEIIGHAIHREETDLDGLRA